MSEMMIVADRAGIDIHDLIRTAAQQSRLNGSIDLAMKRVLDHGQFINGPEVAQLEEELGAYTRARHVISCASGTDALLMVLLAQGIGPGDAVICPSFTFCATGEVVAQRGATPIFVDVNEETLNIDSASLKKGIWLANKIGLKPKAVIPVDLFGQTADHDAVSEVAGTEGLFVLDDAAQSFGANYHGRKLGTFGLATATSFFPAKPLGCFGDGGAIFTNDDELADILRSIRVHGQGAHKYDNVRVGMTARLDTIQAAILLQKLRVFDDEIARRESIAKRYSDALRDVVKVPQVAQRNASVWAQYTIRLPDAIHRQDFIGSLRDQGVPTMVYYERPMHQQTAYRRYPTLDDGLPVSERLSRQVVSLPMHPYLEIEVQDYIIEAVRRALIP